MKYFDKDVFSRLKEGTVTTKTGVVAGFCDGVFAPQAYEELRSTFPDPKTFMLVDKADSGGGHKKFYVGPHYTVNKDRGSVHHLLSLSPAWRGALEEMASPIFMAELSKATGITFNTLCNFGFTYGDEGCVQEPHLDGAIREGETDPIKGNIAFLLYFNEHPDPVSATEIYDVDRKTILLKGNTMVNSWVFFIQHPNSWHGFPPIPKGHTRRLLSLTYANVPEPIQINWGYFHKLRVRLGKLNQKILKKLKS